MAKSEKNNNIYVVDDNEKLLNDQEELYLYFFDAVQEIIQREKIQYNGVQGSKQTSLVMSYNQFNYILLRLNDKIISKNKALTKNGNEWDFKKLENIYAVYCRLCNYYSFLPSVYAFFNSLIGIDEVKIVDALTAGKSALLKTAWNNAKNGLFQEMENSPIPLHKLAIANSRYKLQEAAPDVAPVEESAALPDLSGFLSLPDHDKK